MTSNWFKLIMKAMNVQYGKNLILKGAPLIYNKRGAVLTIGDNCTIKSSFLSNLVGLYSRTIIVTRSPEAYIHIGNHVGISGATIYARAGITIGDNTAIGGNVKILDNDFHPIEFEVRNQLLDDPQGGNSDLKFPEYRGQVLLNPCFQHVMILIWKFKGLPRQRG